MIFNLSSSRHLRAPPTETCINDCNNNGICNENLTCECFERFAGKDCSIRTFAGPRPLVVGVLNAAALRLGCA